MRFWWPNVVRFSAPEVNENRHPPMGAYGMPFRVRYAMALRERMLQSAPLRFAALDLFVLAFPYYPPWFSEFLNGLFIQENEAASQQHPMLSLIIVVLLLLLFTCCRSCLLCCARNRPSHIKVGQHQTVRTLV